MLNPLENIEVNLLEIFMRRIHVWLICGTNLRLALCSPATGSMSPSSSFKKVDLPTPFGPTADKNKQLTNILY